MKVTPFKIRYNYDSEDKNIRYAVADGIRIATIVRNENVPARNWGAYSVSINGTKIYAHTLTEAKSHVE